MVSTATQVQTEKPSDPSSIIRSHLEGLSRFYREVMASGEVEAIHRMRVTTRKLQAILDLLQMRPDHLGIRSLKKELRTWRRQLSRVRNYDVFMEMLNKRASAKKPIHFQQYQLIINELQRRREDTFADVRHNLEGLDIDEFARKLGISLGDASANSSARRPAQLESPAAPVHSAESVPETTSRRRGAALATTKQLMEDRARIAGRAEHRLHQRLHEFQELADEVRPNDEPNDIHQLRIAAKRLRYSIEVVTGLKYGKADRAIAWLKRLQDRLGDLHDIDCFEEEIADIIGRPDFVRDRMAESGNMLHAASRLIGKRNAMARSLLPVRIPPFVAATTHRLVRRLSDAAHSQNDK
jgi:CHAD domain-containing protein